MWVTVCIPGLIRYFGIWKKKQATVVLICFYVRNRWNLLKGQMEQGESVKAVWCEIGSDRNGQKKYFALVWAHGMDEEWKVDQLSVYD